MSPQTPGRLILVSNRLPVVASVEDGSVRLSSAAGGLATGLRRWHEESGGPWIGWPGDVSGFTPEQRAALDLQLAERAILPIHLSQSQIDRCYNGFVNRVLWPLFHYQVDRVPIDAAGWDAYRDVNDAFATAVAEAYEPGDTVWVHDYQLMLVQDMLRRRLPEARIGFFLHTPFPSSEVFRVLPWRREILRGLLGADLVGFHTVSYLRHFMSSLLHIEGLEADVDRLDVGGRHVQVGVFPMGIDAPRFAGLAQDPTVIAEAATIRRDAGGRRIVLGVDRLDYTKGVPRRLLALERLLARAPALRDEVRYIQVAVPSRGDLESYRRFRRQVEETVGRINGACGTLRSTPVHYIHGSVSERRLVALYCAADVMLVTPLRDGMNLVAKEFAASRVDNDGVLILSEFAGAACELDGAIVVNPYAVDDVTTALERALAMQPVERRARMQRMRRRVLEHDVHVWARGFLDRLGLTSAAGGSSRRARPEPSLRTVLTAAGQAEHLCLLLDYDGTLVPYARRPELAVPDVESLALLEALAQSDNISLHLVSGRTRDTMQAWFGHLPIDLWAEHGFWHRPAHRNTGRTPGMLWAESDSGSRSVVVAEWRPAADIDPEWKQRVYPILEQFTALTQGSHIEGKTASVAWHYRGACREFGARQAHELRMLLGDVLSNQPLEVLAGKRVVEVRLRGVSKAMVAHRLSPDLRRGGSIVAIGDDQTDEELFAALPASSITVAVGNAVTRARYRVASHVVVRNLLRTLTLADGRAVVPGPMPTPEERT